MQVDARTQVILRASALRMASAELAALADQLEREGGVRRKVSIGDVELEVSGGALARPVKRARTWTPHVSQVQYDAMVHELLVKAHPGGVLGVAFHEQAIKDFGLPYQQTGPRLSEWWKRAGRNVSTRETARNDKTGRITHLYTLK